MHVRVEAAEYDAIYRRGRAEGIGVPEVMRRYMRIGLRSAEPIGEALVGAYRSMSQIFRARPSDDFFVQNLIRREEQAAQRAARG